MTEILLSIHGMGEKISRYANKIDDAIKGVFIPGRLFEDLGFRYVGPLDGHDTDVLIDALEALKGAKGPTLVHVITRKGKGYKAAEEKADVWHGASPLDIKTGVFHKKVSNPAYTAIFADALIELAEKEQSRVGITAAMPSGTGTSNFDNSFPDRSLDLGMSQRPASDFAGSWALSGPGPAIST